MRILTISQYFPPDITAAAFRIYDLIRCVARDHHEIVLLTSHPHKAQASTEILKIPKRVHVNRTHLMRIGDGGTLRYVSHYLSFVIGSIIQGLGYWTRFQKFDLVWVSSPPLFAGISGLVLSRVFRCPLILEIRDIWPDTAVAAGQISESGRAYKIGRKLELLLYQKAQQIVCVSRPMSLYIREHTDTPVSVVYNGVSEIDAKIDSQPTRLNENTSLSRVILYAGNLGLLQELDLLIRAFGELRASGFMQNWRLRFIGAGPEHGNLSNLITSLGLENVILIEPPRGRDEVWHISKEANLLFVSLKHHPVLSRTIPSKIFDCLLAERPILACLEGEATEILAETGANLFCAPSDKNALIAMLKEAVERYDELSLNASKNKKLVLERFTRERGAETLMKVFDRAINGEATPDNISASKY